MTSTHSTQINLTSSFSSHSNLFSFPFPYTLQYKYTHISKKKVCQSGPVAVSRLSASLSRGRSSTVTSTDQMTGKLVVSVTDTGAGISPQNQNRLFKEIVQFNPEKLQSGGGSGLGLWISGGIINLHDGEISVYSEGEGKGSSFTLELPMVRTPPRPPPSTMRSNNSNIAFLGSSAKSRSLPTLPKTPLESVSRSSPSPPPIAVIPSPTYTLLVVDDSRLNRKMLLKCLRADGHTCSEAADGLEAIAMVKDKIDHANGGNDKPFDAILMDFIMPNMDGPTATQEIRAMGYKAPIFGVTGNGKFLSYCKMHICYLYLVFYIHILYCVLLYTSIYIYFHFLLDFFFLTFILQYLLINLFP
jgi:CheY-like chemotaxis protein